MITSLVLPFFLLISGYRARDDGYAVIWALLAYLGILDLIENKEPNAKVQD